MLGLDRLTELLRVAGVRSGNDHHSSIFFCRLRRLQQLRRECRSAIQNSLANMGTATNDTDASDALVAFDFSRVRPLVDLSRLSISLCGDITACDDNEDFSGDEHGHWMRL
jgi:hypothetical protein